MGKEMYNEQVYAIDATINSQNWAKGVYFITISNGNKVINRRVIKL